MDAIDEIKGKANEIPVNLKAILTRSQRRRRRPTPGCRG